MSFTAADVQRWLKDNPDLSIVGEPLQGRKPPCTPGSQPQPRIPSRLEEDFLAKWRLLGGPALEAEYLFDAIRDWRADFAHVPSRTLIEIEGGIYSGGRHVRGKGYEDDCKKYNAATMQGWRVIRLTAAMLQPDVIERVIQFVTGRVDW